MRNAEKPISVGDLVMVVRGHECVVNLKGGIPYRVKGFSMQKNGGWMCGECGSKDLAVNDLVAAILWQVIPGNGIPLSWLKRIDPDALTDDVQTKEELTA